MGSSPRLTVVKSLYTYSSVLKGHTIGFRISFESSLVMSVTNETKTLTLYRYRDYKR